MGKEIEKKFLLSEINNVPLPDKYISLSIKQGYLLAEKGKQIRIRLVNGKAILGIKFTKSLVRDEFEYEIPYSDGVELFSKCKYTLDKERISFKIGDETYDIDTYPDSIKFIEVEFNSLEALNNWVKPKWLGEEITGRKEYSNIKIAKNKLTDNKKKK